MSIVMELGKQGKIAWDYLVQATTKEKNQLLHRMAQCLEEDKARILEANKQDLIEGEQSGLTPSLLDRLALSEQRLNVMAEGIRKVARLDDPIGYIEEMWTVENGLQIGRKRVPIGLIGIIYEARPNVTSDAAALCIKAGNSVILRGGKEAFRTNQAIVHSLQNALRHCQMPATCIQLLEDLSRETAKELMKCNQYLDLLIPRGGAGLIQSVIEHATVPVIETGIGNCHLYLDEGCDVNMAIEIARNGKLSRPSVCNSLEKILIHEAERESLLSELITLFKKEGVEVRGNEDVQRIDETIVLATEEDWTKEYLDKIIAIKIVPSIEKAMAHINEYGSHHSDAIVTNDYRRAQQFLNGVHSAAVYVNASTRFTDGEEFGFGAEIGISTQKLHARGPMGLKELTTTKYIVYGNGQIR